MGKDFDIIKLSGSDNYHLWKFAITNVMEFKGLSDAIKPKSATTPNEPKLTDAPKLAQAKALISLSVETHIYAHIQTASSAIEIWNILKKLYDDRGLTRRITLLRELISIRLDDMDNMNDYIDKIKTTSNKLVGIGFNLTEEWLGAIMLAGLTDEFRPLIMTIEGNNEPINSDNISSKLLDMHSSKTSSTAFFNKNKKKSKAVKKCHKCNSNQHYTNQCGKTGDKNNKKDNEKEKKKAAFVALLCSESKNNWYIDSGASRHMTHSDSGMKNLRETDVKDIMSANNENMGVKKCGDLTIQNDDVEINVKGALFVPELAVNLLSVHKICENGNTVFFNKDGCTIKNASGDRVAYCKQSNGVYPLKAAEKCLVAKNKVDGVTWHRRLGHVSYGTMKKMKKNMPEMDFVENSELQIKNCEVCARAKSKRLPFKPSETRSTEILQLLHTDLMGPMETPSIGHAKYLLTVIDDYSRYVFVFFLKKKSEVMENLKDFKVFIENQTNQKIKAIRSDGGGEYTSKEMQNFCAKYGIQHQMTTAYTPEQNGVAERWNRTLTEKAKCLLFDADLPKCFWAEAMNMAAFLKNRTISASLNDQYPYELFHNKKTEISDLRIFGTTVMVHKPKQLRRKLDPASSKMVFVGYDSDRKGYRCINTETKKMCISRDVIFHEKITNQNMPIDSDEESENGNNDNGSDESITTVGASEADDTEVEVDDEEVNTTVVQNLSGGQNVSSSNNETVHANDNNNALSLDGDASNANDNNNASLSQSNVSNVPSANEGNNAVSVSIATASSTPAVPTRTSSKETKKVRSFQLNACFALYTEPSTAEEALNHSEAEKWKAAMDSEMNSHQVNNTWTLQNLPNGRKAIKSRWVFKIKDSANDKRYKARLVAKGYSQRYGIDYEETFSPVVRTASLRIMFALAVKLKLKIHQVDAITAFLQGDLEEDIYMSQPDGYDDGSGRVCKLNRAIYGLKQAGRQWNKKLSDALISFGLKKSELDPCVFFCARKKLIILVYVDDMLILYERSDDLRELRDYIQSKLNIKDIGHATECIGIRINQSRTKIEIDQEKYIVELLKKYNMYDCKSVKTPSDPNVKLTVQTINESSEITGTVPYQEIVGSLLYLSQGTRPDIAYAVNDVSRFNAKHSIEHWEAVVRILRYLQGTKGKKLCYTCECENDNLHAYSDSDWASDIDKRRSCTGFVINMSGAAINWKSHRQDIVALSSTEAEYIALSATVKDVLWIQQILNEVNADFVGCTIIYGDNSSALKIGNCEAFRERTKHIDVRHHHIRQQISDGKISLAHVSTEKMAADMLTKGVNGPKTALCATLMGLK